VDTGLTVDERVRSTGLSPPQFMILTRIPRTSLIQRARPGAPDRCRQKDPTDPLMRAIRVQKAVIF
jgi:hypothetical protein